MSLFDKLENLHGLDSPSVLPLDPFLALMSQVSPYTSKICFKKQNKTFNATVTLALGIEEDLHQKVGHLS